MHLRSARKAETGKRAPHAAFAPHAADAARSSTADGRLRLDECLRHDGLLWLGPIQRPMSWHAANALCQQGIAGDRHWRLPTSRELAALFRRRPDLNASWPRGFYWSMTLGANGCRQLVRRHDAETYVNDNDRAAFHVVLVRRPRPTEWTLAA